jgi:hypothetical protein
MSAKVTTESIPDICNFGENVILFKKLYYNNILSKKNMHAIEYLPDVEVSDNLVNVILQMCKNLKANVNILSKQEQESLETLFVYIWY